MRKLPMAGGEVVHRLLGQIQETAELLKETEGLNQFGMELEDGVEAAMESVELLLSRLQDTPNDALAGATPFLRLLGTVIGGWLMGKAALAAKAQLDSGSGDRQFLESKLATSRFYGEQILPSALGLADTVAGRADVLFAIPDEALAL